MVDISTKYFHKNAVATTSASHECDIIQKLKVHSELLSYTMLYCAHGLWLCSVFIDIIDVTKHNLCLSWKNLSDCMITEVDQNYTHRLWRAVMS